MERLEGKLVVDPLFGSFPSEKDTPHAVCDRTGCRMGNRGHGFGLVAVVEVVASPHPEAGGELRGLV